MQRAAKHPVLYDLLCSLLVQRVSMPNVLVSDMAWLSSLAPVILNTRCQLQRCHLIFNRGQKRKSRISDKPSILHKPKRSRARSLKHHDNHGHDNNHMEIRQSQARLFRTHLQKLFWNLPKHSWAELPGFTYREKTSKVVCTLQS